MRKILYSPDVAKLAAKARDRYSCRCCQRVIYSYKVEAAHLIDKGMGGDHGRYSCEPKHFVTLCHDCHHGPRSVHSGHIRMVYGPDMGTDLLSSCRRKLLTRTAGICRVTQRLREKSRVHGSRLGNASRKGDPPSPCRELFWWPRWWTGATHSNTSST